MIENEISFLPILMTRETAGGPVVLNQMRHQGAVGFVFLLYARIRMQGRTSKSEKKEKNKKIIRRWLDSGVRVFRQENQGYYQAYITIIFSRLAHPYHKHAFLICDKILLKQRLSHMYQLQYGYPRRLNREGKGCRATLSRSGNKYFATWSCKKGEIQQQSILPKPKNYAIKAQNYANKTCKKYAHV